MNAQDLNQRCHHIRWRNRLIGYDSYGEIQISFFVNEIDFANFAGKADVFDDRDGVVVDRVAIFRLRDGIIWAGRSPFAISSSEKSELRRRIRNRLTRIANI